MSPEKIVHNSYDNYYRTPFGAIETGGKVKFRLKLIPEENEEVVRVIFHIRGEDKDFQEEMSAQKQNDFLVFDLTTSVPVIPQLMFYYFEVNTSQGKFYYGCREKNTGGEGACFQKIPNGYPLTVYNSDLKTPDWIKGANIYQIFVDRFFNGREDKWVFCPKQNSLIHAHWENDPLYIKDDQGEISRWDFFGGNLKGVEKKLPYLDDLGIDVIYFNPLFKAPSNHKYDTEDYHKIDEMFGGEEHFTSLINEASKYDIKIIIEGVFNYTGKNGKYFNKNGSYNTRGAFQSRKSTYFSWYNFYHHPHEYECWWGDEGLPRLKTEDKSLQEYIIFDSDSVLKYWQKKGIRGWMLDSCSALSPEFIENFHKVNHSSQENEVDNVLLGDIPAEYDNLTGPLGSIILRGKLDSLVSDRLRNILLDFFNEKYGVKRLYSLLLEIYEVFPEEMFFSLIHRIGGHNLSRILSEIKQRSGQNQENNAVKKLVQLITCFYTFPGAPLLYYGDEAGLEGAEDPKNRGTFPWGNENEYLQEKYGELLALRSYFDIFKSGSWEPLEDEEELFGYTRCIKNKNDVFGQKKENNQALIVFNHQEEDSQSISGEVVREKLDLKDSESVYDFAGDEDISADISRLELAPLERKVLLKNRWPKRLLQKRGAGILLHITSLPSNSGIGDMGQEAFKFIDFLSRAGQGYWQVLPFNPPVHGASPYQCHSSMAGNPLLISPQKLVSEGWLAEKDLKSKDLFNSKLVDFSQVRKYKESLFSKAYKKFTETKNTVSSYRQFINKNAGWLNDYSLYMALKNKFDGQSWTEWPEKYRDRNDKTLFKFKKEEEQTIQYYKFKQFLFFKQWQDMYEYAHQKDIQIIGDLPIFVAHDSSDVWANRELFKLDRKGYPLSVAGVPPDDFSDTGQRWGNPLYDWEKMKENGFNWWQKRLSFLEDMVDLIRIDHFRGFEAYWEIPASEKNAVKGEWIEAPGDEFFEIVTDKYSDLDIIAEDLGVITPEVKDLKNKYSFPGMKVMQFISNPEQKKINIPLHQWENIFYTGTHDNKTLWQWYEEYHNKKNIKIEESREKICWHYIEEAFRCWAQTTVIPLQDFLCLGGEARMNVPATVKDNWNWRFQWSQFPDNLAEKIRNLTKKYHR